MCKKKTTEHEEFCEFVGDCQVYRMEKLRNDFYTGEEYLKYSDMESEIYDRIMATLPEDMHQSLLDYDSIVGHILCMAEEYYYKQGFADAMLLVKMMSGGLSELKLDVKVA